MVRVQVYFLLLLCQSSLFQIVLEAFIYMLMFYSFPLQTLASFRDHPLACLHHSLLILIGISKSTQGTIILGYASGLGVIINSVPRLEINYKVTIKYSSILATLPLSSVVSYCLIVLCSPNSCQLSWGHPRPLYCIPTSQVIDHLLLHSAPVTHGCHLTSYYCSVDINWGPPESQVQPSH